MQLSYKKLNNYLGIFVFILSSIVYLLTIEPNISFWDTGEYIASAAKLEVTHSPGAAFFQLVGAVFAGLAFENGALYPKLINSMNAIISGVCIKFTFWAISYFMLKIAEQKESFNKETIAGKLVVFGAALVGSLIFAFSDTFWYSAVEGEVYAMASCFIALLIWLATKYDRETDATYENRWLLLIALIIGLSVGVHMMVLLAVPAICYIYYQKNYEITLKSFLIANVVTALVLAFVFMFIFPFIMNFFGKSEIFFVNELGMSFNSGLFAALIIVALVFYLIFYFTRKVGLPTLNTITWAILFMLIGFSCWMMIPIRANANPPMNLNNPDNAIGMKDYYNREQYGDWPIFYGAYYTAYLDQGGITKTVNTSPIYIKNEKKGRYEKAGYHFKYEFNPKHVGLFPRMYYPQNDNGVQDNYAYYGEYPDFKTKSEYAGNKEVEDAVNHLKDMKATGKISISDYNNLKEYIDIMPPSLSENMRFFMQYQIGGMFVRYLLWNFAGKQNDKEWHNDPFNGNWEDGLVVNESKQLPSKFTNKGTNHYYFLPLILGLIGIFYQLNRDFGRFYALLSLFLLAGVGIILYTNVKPWEPRERDYALVGSFYVFAIWAGLGAGFLLEFLQDKLKNQKATIAGVLLLLAVPVQMAFENWDDHDRSHRHTAYDEAYSYLKPLGKEPILFVYGDNDTYPLWGVQETSGLRTDAKVINYTLLGTSWYIKQTQRKTYEAEKLPHSLNYDQYKEGVNDAVILFDAKLLNQVFNELDGLWENLAQYGYKKSEFEDYTQYIQKDSMTAQEAIEFLKHPTERRKKFIKLISTYLYGNSQSDFNEYNFLPVSKIVIPVNKENCLKYGIVNPEDAALMQDQITVNLRQGSLRKAELAMLDLFANYHWDRPIYFSSGGVMDPVSTFYLNEYTEFQGFIYKLVPINTPRSEYGEYGRINTSNIYNIVMNDFKWGNFKDPKAHFDEAGLNNIINYRMTAGRAAVALAKAGEKQKAIEVLNKCMEEIPIEKYPGTPSMDDIIYGYMMAGDEKEGLELAQQYQSNLMEEYEIYEQLPPLEQRKLSREIQRVNSYFAFSATSVIDAYIDLGEKDKAINYTNTILKVWYKKFDDIIAVVEKGGQEALKQNDDDIQRIIQAFATVTSPMKKVDSTYVLEKQLEMEMRMNKLDKASGGF